MTDRLFVLIRLPLILMLALVLAACGGPQGSGQDQGKDQQSQQQAGGKESAPPAPEPAKSPQAGDNPAGEVVDIGKKPEGVVADPKTGLVAVSTRDPARLVLLDGATGEVARRVDLPKKARHLALFAPGGPVLVPSERSNSLLQVSLAGEVLRKTSVGEFPHNAAAYGGRIFVVNEFGSTASIIQGGKMVNTFKTPFQPGGIAATPDGLLGVLGVRGLTLEVFDADSLESMGRVDAGDGPTHVVAGPEGRLYVADTRGDAVLVYETSPKPSKAGRIPLPGGAPYGLALDAARDQLWVTLTAENHVVRYALDGKEPRKLDAYPTVRQPNSVAVNPDTGRVFVAGVRGGELQIIDPRQAPPEES